MNIFETAEKTLEWAAARNLLEGTNAPKQFLKVIEETGEIDTALVGVMRKQMEAARTGETVDANAEIDELKDAFGDSVVTVVIFAAQHGIDVNAMITNAQNRLTEQREVSSILSGIGRIASALARSKPVDVIEEACTELTFTLIRYSNEFGLFTIDEAFEAAYDVIKHRRGVMRDGVFIKEEDLAEGEVAKTF